MARPTWTLTGPLSAPHGAVLAGTEITLSLVPGVSRDPSGSDLRAGSTVAVVGADGTLTVKGTGDPVMLLASSPDAPVHYRLSCIPRVLPTVTFTAPEGGSLALDDIVPETPAPIPAVDASTLRAEWQAALAALVLDAGGVTLAQVQSEVSGEAASRSAADAAHVAAADPHPQYATDTALAAEVTARQAADDTLTAAVAGHAHTLDDLSDVDVTAATLGQVLTKTAGGWGPATPAAGSMAGAVGPSTVLRTHPYPDTYNSNMIGGGGECRLYPVLVARGFTAASASVECCGAAAGNQTQLGVYQASDSGVLTRVALLGTVDGSTTGLKTLTGPWTIPAGIVWIAGVKTAGGDSYWRGSNTAAQCGLVPRMAGSAINNVTVCLRQNGLAGGLPLTLNPVADDVYRPQFSAAFEGVTFA